MTDIDIKYEQLGGPASVLGVFHCDCPTSFATVGRQLSPCPREFVVVRDRNVFCDVFE